MHAARFSIREKQTDRQTDRGKEREGEGETETETDRDRERDRWRQRERQGAREVERERERERERWREGVRERERLAWQAPGHSWRRGVSADHAHGGQRLGDRQRWLPRPCFPAETVLTPPSAP